MPLSFGRRSKANTGLDVLAIPLQPDCRVITQAYSRLVDVRSPAAFRAGFIPGSYSVPDTACMAAARRGGLFSGRQIYLLADDIDQLHLYNDAEGVRPEATDARACRPEIVGWFGPDAIDEWQRNNVIVGSWDLIKAKTLTAQASAGDMLILDIYDREERPLSHPAALRFSIDELPRALHGLPVDSSLCVTAASSGLISFAASLLWNFGFHRMVCSEDRPPTF